MPGNKLFSSSTSINSQQQQINAELDVLRQQVVDRRGFRKSILTDLRPELARQLQALCPAGKSLGSVLIAKMPKTDLHVHGEAGILFDVDLARDIAARNRIEFPEDLVDVANNCWKYRGQKDFMVFIKDFITISNLIRTPKDIEDIAYSFLQDCYQNNVIFTLIGISWLQCRSRMSFVEFNEAYNRGLKRAMVDFGQVTVSRLRYYQERHFSKEVFEEVRALLKAHPNPLIMVLGLAGDENNHPFIQFIQYYLEDQLSRKQIENPWYFLTAHMEEHSSSQDIACLAGIVDWMAHGRKIADDDNYLHTMKDLGMHFEICPNSDVTCYPEQIADVGHHRQLNKIMSVGIASLNSDDPSFFRNVNKVFVDVHEQLFKSFNQLLECTINGLCPASPRCLWEMSDFRSDKYDEFMSMVVLGLLKVLFFKCYWELLPMLANVDDNTLQADLFAVDLKTSLETLNQLMRRVPDQEMRLKNQVGLLVEVRGRLNHLNSEYVERTILEMDGYCERNSFLENEGYSARFTS